MGCGHIDLVAALTREADAHDARLDTGYGAFTVGHKGEGHIVKVHVVAQFFQYVAALASHKRSGGPMVGHSGQIDLQMWPFGL